MKRSQQILVLVTAFFMVVSILSSCKKNVNDDDDDELPAFGTCTAVEASGRMNFSTGDGKYTYVTSGGGKIVIDHTLQIIISHQDYPGFSLEFWGSVDGGAASYNHENVNGTHVKDRVGNRRSVVFPDGAKMTISVNEPLGPAVSITIYDHDQVHHINPTCNTLEYSGGSAAIVKMLDDKEADGETATFEITSTGLKYYNVYTETTAGNKNAGEKAIAEIYKNNPDQVNDFWTN